MTFSLHRVATVIADLLTEIRSGVKRDMDYYLNVNVDASGKYVNEEVFNTLATPGQTSKPKACSRWTSTHSEDSQPASSSSQPASSPSDQCSRLHCIQKHLSIQMFPALITWTNGYLDSLIQHVHGLQSALHACIQESHLNRPVTTDSHWHHLPGNLGVPDPEADLSHQLCLRANLHNKNLPARTKTQTPHQNGKGTKISVLSPHENGSNSQSKSLTSPAFRLPPPFVPRTFSILLLVYFLTCACPHPSQACYKFPPGVSDPCEREKCMYGAECQPSQDGKSARCQCPADCPSYGDK